MKKALLFAFICSVNIGAVAQIEASDKNKTKTDQWVMTANKLPGSTGRILIDNPAGSTWTVYIYAMADEKYITSYAESNNKGVFVLAPGTYKITLNNVPVLNVPVQKGYDTKIKSAVFNVEDEAVWYLHDETGDAYYTSGDKPQKLVLPIGNYIYKAGGSDQRVTVKEEGADKAPDKFSVDAERYTMTPVSENGNLKSGNNPGKGKGLLWLLPGNTAFAYTSYKIIEAIKTGDDTAVFRCSYFLPGSQHCWEKVSLPVGDYQIKVSVHRVGSADQSTGHYCDYACPPIILPNIPIRDGYETKLKFGYLQPEHPGVYGITDEPDPTGCFTFYASSKIAFPVGKYQVRHFFVGDSRVEIRDGETASLGTMDLASIPNPKWKSNVLIAKPEYPLKARTGRLNCFFPNPTGNWVRLLRPNPNNSTTYTYINLDTLKFIDLEEGNYRLNLNSIVEDIVIEAKKETRLLFGYFQIKITGGESWTLIPVNAAITSSASGASSKTIAVPVGYYKLNVGAIQSLIKIDEGATIAFNYPGIFCF